MKGRRDRETDIDFDLDFLLFKGFSGTSTPTGGEEMFAPSLVNEENKPLHQIKKVFQPQVSPSENMENKKAIHSVCHFTFIITAIFFFAQL